MKVSHAFETLLVRGLSAGVRAMSWRASLRFGAGLGGLAQGLGLRRAVAEANLALAFPERTPEARARILDQAYRCFGQTVCEYARLDQLGRAPLGEVIVAARGLEHVDAVAREGRGAIMLGAHYGSIELLGAWFAQRHPVDFVVKSLSNPGVEAIRTRLLTDAGIGLIPLGAGVRRIFAALREGRMVAMLADQDARGEGVFVSFMGRLASTPAGPAAIALRTGAPIVMGFITRRPDGRHEVDFEPPLRPSGGDGPEAVRALTARHAACLEQWVRRHPEMWFWLHRRWKTSPPPDAAHPAVGRDAGAAPGATATATDAVARP